MFICEIRMVLEYKIFEGISEERRLRMNERDNIIDLLKGVSIVWIMFCHASQVIGGGESVYY